MPEDTTTTTTEAEETTTTTTQEETVTTTTSPTGEDASINHPGGEASPMAERQGEVAVDKDAKTDVLGDDLPENHAEAHDQNIEQAKQDALTNHAAEQNSTSPDDTDQESE